MSEPMAGTGQQEARKELQQEVQQEAPPVAEPAPCRERTVFPWTGRLSTGVMLGLVSLAAGEHVTVTGKQDGMFLISVERGGGTRTGQVAAGSVDEVLGSLIREYLLGRTNVTWGYRGAWRGRGRASQDFELDSDADPDGKVTVTVDDVVAFQPSAEQEGMCEVVVSGASGLVAAALVTPDTTLPPATSAFELMCYEFGPYAAALGGLCPGFVNAVNNKRTQGAQQDSHEYWTGVLGGTLRDGQIGVTQLAGQNFDRGDLVIFYDDDTGIHTAIATGDGQSAYSLWSDPESFPVTSTIQALSVVAPGQPPTHVRTATPRWHTPRT